MNWHPTRRGILVESVKLSFDSAIVHFDPCVWYISLTDQYGVEGPGFLLERREELDLVKFTCFVDRRTGGAKSNSTIGPLINVKSLSSNRLVRGQFS